MKKKSLNKQIRRYIGKGKRYFSQNKFDKAIQCFDKAIEINPNIAEIYVYRGDINYIINEEQAIKDYTEAIKLNPKSLKAYYSRGILHEVIFNETEKALFDYTQAIKINSDYQEAYVCRANVYSQKEQYELSIADYTKALLLKPDDYQTHIYRGKDYSYINEFDKAKEDFLTALKGSFYSAYFYLGRLELQKGNYIEAIPYYTNSIQQHCSKHIDSYFERGCCYMCTEEYENAISDFTQTINMALKDSNFSDKIAEFYFERAGAYLAFGNEIAYKADLQTAEDFKSGNRVIEEEWTEA